MDGFQVVGAADKDMSRTARAFISFGEDEET
jgi:hypothetical protein